MAGALSGHGNSRIVGKMCINTNIHAFVSGGDKVCQVGGSIGGLRLSTFRVNVLTNWLAKMMLL